MRIELGSAEVISWMRAALVAKDIVSELREHPGMFVVKCGSDFARAGTGPPTHFGGWRIPDLYIPDPAIQNPVRTS
jgi:hypothetical protein